MNTENISDWRKRQGRTYHENYIAGKFEAGFKGKHHSEETRKILSEKRKIYLQEHSSEHVWKRSNKFISKPCEYLKQQFRDNNIQFVEEYTPLDDYNFSIDIAWPDVKVGIEVNGNQHYNSDGSLVEYYNNRHNILEERGWKIYEIHYTKCYKLDIKNFVDLEKLDVFDKDYVGKYFSNKELKRIKREDKIKEKEEKKNEKERLFEYRRTLLIDLEQNSNIDFSKFGWVNFAKDYLLKKDSSIPVKQLHRFIKYYYPEFFENSNVFMRKGTVI